MAQEHTRSGDVVSVLPLGKALKDNVTTALLKAEQLEVARVVLLAGKEMREHKAPGEVTLLCLEGKLEIRTPALTQVLQAGDFVHLRRAEPHALKALQDSSALLTMCLLA